ncbi:MAG TPA: glycosyltransferase [Actinomycetota bacterium]|jgi:trehalose synthase|nr:glycosyltransferase [Actinomycetota bacterium]
MPHLERVEVRALAPQRFKEVIPVERYDRFAEAIAQARALLADRVVWNVNSTAKGGGVAEMLQSLIAYAKGAGVDARWVVIEGDPDFFTITKRIHNRLHGAEGSPGELAGAEHAAYEHALEANGEALLEEVAAGDIVLLHDPQTAGLTRTLKDAGAVVIWRCHVGLDMPNELAREAWRFLIPYITAADAYVFSRQAFQWEGLEQGKMHVIPPSIDAFSPKNQDMSPATVDAILSATGLVEGDENVPPAFLRVDGSEGKVTRPTQLFDLPPLRAGTRIIVQVSRWDRLKDPLGVMQGFAEHVPLEDAHLVLAGPSVEAVADDPEGAEVLAETHSAWEGLPAAGRERVHLACLPMEDGAENAAIVNAIQRRAEIVVQKSIAEGFGLTVAEAMWKGRPVVASRIGGIQDQIEDGVTGSLIDDPHDLAAYGAALVNLLENPADAAGIGKAAQERVRDAFLGPRHLMQYIDLIRKLVAGGETAQ